MFKLKLRKLNASNSTNKELKSLLNNNKLKSGDGIWTLNQTDGFGQRGSAWKAQANKHLALSFFYKFENLNPKWIFSINSACSLAVLETLSHFNVNRLSVKWPNDILAGNKKICGILAENQINELKIKSIVGIGINLYEKSFSNLPFATSLFIETYKSPLIDYFIKILSENIIIYLNKCNDASVKKLNKIFNKNLYLYKKQVKFERKGKIFDAKIIKVRMDGMLELKLKNGNLKTFQAKEIKLIF
tara:strand:- start:12722 stop:13456 length:735 start_codon:yes stop_codon:yes gene_type:complete